MLQDPRSLLQLAEERRRSGRLKEAIAVCLDGLTRHPNLDAVRVTLGRSYLEAGQPTEARDALREVFSRHPDHHLAGKLLAEAMKRLGDLEGAASTCREILRHYPRDRELEALLASLEPAPAEAAKAATPPGAQTGAQAASPPRTKAGAQAAVSDPSPDYLPEDVASAAPTPPRIAEDSAGPSSSRVAETATVQAPKHATDVITGPAPTLGTAARTRPQADALQTNTLAELYARQGLVDRALEVYRGMSRLDPANESLRRRIDELERGGAHAAGPGMVGTPAPAPERSPAQFRATTSASVGMEAPGAAQDPAPVSRTGVASQPHATKAPARGPQVSAGKEQAAIERLQRWLDSIREGSEGRGRAGASR